MSKVEIKSKVKFSELLKAIEQLAPKELEQLICKVRKIQARNHTPGYKKIEQELIEKIQMSLPAKMEDRYQLLLHKKQQGILSKKEEQELMQIVEHIEELDLKKAEAIYTLANIKGLSGKDLLNHLAV